MLRVVFCIEKDQCRLMMVFMERECRVKGDPLSCIFTLLHRHHFHRHDIFLPFKKNTYSVFFFFLFTIFTEAMVAW